jgi:hypothetical protein
MWLILILTVREYETPNWSCNWAQCFNLIYLPCREKQGSGVVMISLSLAACVSVFVPVLAYEYPPQQLLSNLQRSPLIGAFHLTRIQTYALTHSPPKNKELRKIEIESADVEREKIFLGISRMKSDRSSLIFSFFILLPLPIFSL